MKVWADMVNKKDEEKGEVLVDKMAYVVHVVGNELLLHMLLLLDIHCNDQQHM